MPLVLAIDLGGTNCRAAVADAASRAIVGRATAPLAGTSDLAALLALFERLGREAADQSASGAAWQAAGLAVPGVVERASGRVSVLSNLPQAPRGVPLGALLAERWGVPVWIENDVRAAALAERARGWGRECPNFIFAGLGTGTSAAVVLGGELWRGAHEAAGEIAFALTSRDALGRDFGEHGCIESFASGYGLARAYGSADGARAVFAAAEAGDRRARELIEAALDAWAIALSGPIAALDPDAVVLGGGIGLRPDVRAGLEARLRPPLAPFMFRLECSQLGADAQLWGALDGAIGRIARDWR